MGLVRHPLLSPMAYVNPPSRVVQWAVHFSYLISDGVSYSVQTNLTISTTSAFATVKNLLGNPYQVVKNVTGTRKYTYLPSGAMVVSNVTGLVTGRTRRTNTEVLSYALLSAAPGNEWSVDGRIFYDGADNAVPMTSLHPIMRML